MVTFCVNDDGLHSFDHLGVHGFVLILSKFHPFLVVLQSSNIRFNRFCLLHNSGFEELMGDVYIENEISEMPLTVSTSSLSPITTVHY